MKERMVILIDKRIIEKIDQEARDRSVSIDQVIEEKLRKEFGI